MAQVLKVTWLDAHSVDDWADAGKLDEHDFLCTSAGYFVGATEDRLVLAHTLSMEGGKVERVCGQMVIPRVAIKSVEWVKPTR